MKQSGNVNGNDRFYFAGEVKFSSCEEGWLVISVHSGNWIVIRTELQKRILEKFIEGHTVGEIIPLITNADEMNQLKALLGAIFARQFASTTEVPEIHYLEGYKMLNCYLTNACNLRCEHCFMHAGRKLQGELTTNEWKKVLKEFHDEGGECVTFSGGEPLMRTDFDEIVKYSAQLGLSVTILSNGILWTKGKIELLAPYIKEIQISLDGVDEQSNAMVRGNGYFNKTLDSVILFANQGVRTSVATTFTFQNLQENTKELYRQMVNRIKERCNNPVFFKLSKKILRGRQTDYTEIENKEYFNRIVEIENNLDPHAKYNNFMEGHTENLVEKNCGFGGISVGADGEVYFCNRISEVDSYGNVKDMPLKKFMNMGRELHQKTSVDMLTPCKDCHLRYICSGGCRIDDCNFQGRLIGHEGELKQINCSLENRQRIERKMIDSFNFYYKFDI